MKMLPDEVKTAHQLIDILEDQIKELEEFSAYNDDVFNVQLITLKQMVLDLRKQLL